jgi:hypothetical protein
VERLSACLHLTDRLTVSAIQQNLFSTPTPTNFPPGFRYFENAISQAEEAALISKVQELPFKDFHFHGFEGKRRIVSFGWRYDFGQHKAFPADPIPAFLHFCTRLTKRFNPAAASNFRVCNKHW